MYKKLFVWALCVLTAGLVSAQKQTDITGRVVAAEGDGETVPFATIRLLDADSMLIGGTTGDIDGCFKLKMTDGASVIAVSCLGYETEYMAVEKAMQSVGDTQTVCLWPHMTALDGVTVTGNTVKTKADRRVLLPDSEQRRSATDGIDLLRRMKPARLTVNQLTGAVSMAGGGEVLLCVNGVQTGMIRRGNPSLKPFRVLDQQVSASINSTLVDVDVTLGYRHEYRPIMESVLFEDGLFVRTYANQRSFRRPNAEATVTLRTWRKHLSVAITPLVYRYISHGNDYRHTHTISRLKVDADLTFGNRMLSYNTMMGAANTMYGEESLEEKNMNILLMGYRQPRWTVQAGILNAFVNEYWMMTQNNNALTPFTSRAHCDRNMYFAMKLSLNISSGRQPRDRQQRINNEDKDAGIMHGTK